MKKSVFSLLLLAVVMQCAFSQENGIFNVKDFGATGRKDQVATKYIQNCIDSCYNSKGGTVYFAPGDYTSGTLTLKDNVILLVDAGATIYGSRDPKDYPRSVLITATGAKNIGIHGKGKIDIQAERVYEDLKQADSFIGDYTELARQAGVEMKMYYKVRPTPRLIHFINCNNIVVRDISLFESSIWTLHIQWCENVFIDNIYLYSDLVKGVNADGIDIDGCKNVVISNCIVKTGDDAIVLKTSPVRDGGIAPSCENITVSNCIVTSTSSGLKLGTESYGDFRHIIFSNCVVRNTNRGLGIVIRDGALVEDVIFADITIECNRKHFNWWGNGDPIWVVLLKRNPDSKLGIIRNVSFENIIATGQGTSKIEGYEGHPLQNIKLSNVQLFMEPESTPDKRAVEAFAAHDVKNLTLSDCQVYWNKEKQEPKWSSAFAFDKIETLWLEKLVCSQAPGKDIEAVSIKDSQDVIIERCFANPGTGVFLNIKGAQTRNITFGQNYLGNAAKSYNSDKSVNKKEVHPQD